MPELSRRDFFDMSALPDIDLYTYQQWHYKLWQKFELQLLQNYPGLKLPQLFRFFKDGLLGKLPFTGQEKINLQYRDILDAWLHHLAEGKPLAHWVGLAWFHQIALTVDHNVLIPRPETEILVEQAVVILKQIENPLVVDLGTGPGTISLALASALKSKTTLRILAIDISPAALKLARWNIFLAREENRIELITSDRLFSLPEAFWGKVDMVVSNPPYIKKLAHHHLVHQQVKNYEPEIALFLADDDYEQWQNIFFTQIHDCLKPGGHFIVEGHEDELPIIMQMKCCQRFQNMKIIKDYTDRVRFIYGQKL